MKRATLFMVAAVTAIFLAGAAGLVPAFGQDGSSAQAQTSAPEDSPRSVVLSGELDVIWGDPRPGSDKGPTLDYVFNDGQGRSAELLLDEGRVRELGGPLALNGRRVEVEGTPASRVRGGPVVADERIEVGSIRLEEPGLTAASTRATVSGPQPAVAILCRFADSTAVTPHPPSWFQPLLTGPKPSMDDYWRQASYGKINASGSKVARWFNLPRPRSYYQGNYQRLLDDCTRAADPSVNFSGSETIHMMFNQDPLGFALGGQWWSLKLDGKQGFGVTWMPPWAYENQAILAHETGHTYGLPHSSGPYSDTYDSDWDVMSNSLRTCPPPHPVYGCLGMHTISYHKDRLGWIPAARRYVARAGSTRTLTLERLAWPAANGAYLMAKVPIGTSTTKFYTVEARRFAGYDAKVPGEAVVIHKVNTGAFDRPARVVDATRNGDPNDAGAMWLPGETFTDSANGISVRVTGATTTGYTVRVTKGG